MKFDPRKYFVVSAIVAAGWASAGAAEAATTYRLTEIGGLAADDLQHISEATGINALSQATGNIVGFRDVSGFIDTNGAVTPLSADTFTRALAINDAGHAVGWYGASSGNPRQAYVAVGGVIQPLGSGGSSEAAAINFSGQIAGSATTAGGETHAFSYLNGVAIDLGTFAGGTTSRAFGINASGQVTGFSDLQGGAVSHAFRYSGQGLEDLGTLTGGSNSRGNDINAAGDVTGAATLADGLDHAFVYTGNAMLALPSLGANPGSIGYGINSAGEVIGAATDSFGDAAGAFIYSKGVITDLNTLLDPVTGAGWTLLEGRDINDKGQIVGNGFDADGNRRAFLLTPIAPVPEPGSYALMLVGLGALGVAARRRRLAPA